MQGREAREVVSISAAWCSHSQVFVMACMRLMQDSGCRNTENSDLRGSGQHPGHIPRCPWGCPGGEEQLGAHFQKCARGKWALFDCAAGNAI